MKQQMKTLLKNEFCEIKRTIEGKLLRVDLVLNTEEYVEYFLDDNNKVIR